MESSEATGYRWNVCVDGSEISQDAFNIVFRQLMKDDDHITVSHVFSNSKDDYLSYKYKPENIKQDYEAELIATSKSKWSMVWEHLDKGLSTKEHLMKIAKTDKANMIAMGYIGRKGPKEDPTLLGSAVEYVAHHPVCPILVVKRVEKREDKDGKGFKFLVCCDGSQKSYDALEHTIQIMDKSVDSISVLVVALASIKVKTVEEKTNKILEDSGVANHTFEKIERDSDEYTHDAICDHINIDTEEYIDFVTVANQGEGYSKHTEKKYLGKVAKGVLSKSKANVLLFF